MLRQFFVMLLVSVMGFSAAIEHAEARRLGGGSSMGSVSRSADRPASRNSNRVNNDDACGMANHPAYLLRPSANHLTFRDG